MVHRRLCEAPDLHTLHGLRDRALLATLASSGCRVSEVVALTTTQIVVSAGRFQVQVMGKHQTAPLSTTAVRQLLRHYAAVAGLPPVTPHDFRRFVGTQLAKRDVRQAQRALGHADIATTAKHYIFDELEVGVTDGLY